MKNNFLIVVGILMCIAITPKENTFIWNRNIPLEQKEIEYKEIIVENIEFQNNDNSVPNYYDITEYERELLARLLYTEARGESIECQKAVISVIFNRLEFGYWGNSIESVIKAEGQFDLGNKLDGIKPYDTQYEVVDYVVQNGSTLPRRCNLF